MQAIREGFKETVVNKVSIIISGSYKTKPVPLIRRFGSDLCCCVCDVSLGLQDGFVAIRRIRAKMRLKSHATPGTSECSLQ